MIYFSSDHHFFHNNVLQYCGRPFSSVEEMNEKLIENYNKIVTSKDQVYFLGDFSFGNKEETNKIIRRLNGNKFLILGNHDKQNYKEFGWIKNYYELYVDNQCIVLNHYAQRTWNKAYHGSWHLFGHSHGKLEPFGKSVDVGVDSDWITNYKEYRPFSFDEIKTFMGNVK